MPTNTFNSDESNSQILSRFLDESGFFNQLFEKWKSAPSYKGTHFEYRRESDTDLQRAGIDMTLIVKQNDECKDFLIDEKAQLDYINDKKQTFAFELRNVKSNNVGWFIAPDNRTTHYFLFRKILQNDSSKDLKVHSIQSFTLDVVDKKSLKLFLNLLGISDGVLFELSKTPMNQDYVEATANSCLFRLKALKNQKDFYYKIFIFETPSQKKTENPRNLLINIDDLLEFKKNCKMECEIINSFDVKSYHCIYDSNHRLYSIKAIK